MALSGSDEVLAFSQPCAFGYTEYSYTVTGTGSDTIEFLATNDSNYFFLDDVSVSPAAVTPEFSSLSLLCLGLVGFAARARRRLFT